MNEHEVTESQQMRKTAFSSKFGLLISVLGIAIGTGNIWRFPRIAASASGEDGAGGFLIAWLIFLFAWSIPLIVAEYALGRFSGKSVLTSFLKVGGRKAGWKGGFVVTVALGIMAYYGVITGWCVWYFGAAISGNLPVSPEGAVEFWNQLQNSNFPFLMQILVFLLAGIVVSGGIRVIERVSLILIPALVLVILIILVRAVTLPGSWNGIQFLFSVDLTTLFRYQTWMEALTQNAWDTGAGWGLIISYAAFAGSKDEIVKNAFKTGIANNLMSLIAAITIFSTIFAVLGVSKTQSEIVTILKDGGPASTGLTFMWIPSLFNSIPGGNLFAIIFFAGLSMAAFTSFVSMVQLGSRTMIELGYQPRLSLWGIIGAGIFVGSFSAGDVSILSNQDFVWGLGLMISGLFIVQAIHKFGVQKFADEAVNSVESDWKAGTIWRFVIRYGITVQVFVLLGWWTFRSVTEFAPDTWMNPMVPFSIANCLMYWGISGLILKLLNPFFSIRINNS